MTTSAAPPMFVPQAYPLWVVWYLRWPWEKDRAEAEELASMTDEEIEKACPESPPELVVAWEVSADSVPMPVSTHVGRDTGYPVVGLSPDEAVTKARTMFRAERDGAKTALAAVAGPDAAKADPR